MLQPADEPRRLARAVRQAAVLALLMLLSLSSYLAVLKWRGDAAVWVTRTAWDRHIPFRPEWVWVYLLPYLVGPVVAGSLSRPTFAWFVRRGLAAVLASLAVFVVCPTRTVRPTADGLGDGTTAALYRNMVGIDEPPANAAPSLHVSLTCLLALALVRDYPRWWPAATAGAGLVWLATLLTQQHHLIDVATGILLAGALALPWGRLLSEPEA